MVSKFFLIFLLITHIGEREASMIRHSTVFFRVTAFIFLIMILYVSVGCDSSSDRGQSLDLTDRISNERIQADKNENNALNDEKNVLIFGFDLRNSPSEDAKQYLPFINYLSEVTGLPIKLKFTPKGSDIATELGKGRIHLAAIGATSYINARERYGVQVLARGINNKSKAEYRSIIVIHPTSKLNNLASLKGKQFAFGSIDSTQGHLIPRIELSNVGVGLDELANYEYTGSHLNCANAVISAQMDACGMQDTMAEEFVSKGLLRKLYTSPYYPSSGIAANQAIPKAILDKITKALIDFKPEGKHKELLYHWDKTEMPKGFIRANVEDYVELRKWMIKFKLITEIKSVS